MIKTAAKLLAISIGVLFLVKCQRYEFPKSPYPRVETLDVINISSLGVSLQGNLLQLGEKPIIDHGFVWGYDNDVNLAGKYEGVLKLGALSSASEFHGDVVSGLFKNKTYYVRAFVITDTYKVYGDVVPFKSNGSTPPTIDKFEPLMGTWGDTITIHGKFFANGPLGNKVKFGTLEAKVIEAVESKIICIVPDNIPITSVPITLQITDNITQAEKNFQPTVPTISGFTPASGTFQDEVIIKGSNFGVFLKSHIVTIGGYPAEVLAFSRTSLKVKVPAEVSVKLNEIKLLLNRQTATAAQSFAILPPTISGLSKTEGRIGDQVEITGDYFNARMLGDAVLFGESPATVIAASRTKLVAKLTNGVYPQRTNVVKVTVAEQTATSVATFKMLDPWLRRGYTPGAEISSGGFVINDIGYFIARSFTYSYDPLANVWVQKANFPGIYRLDPLTIAIGNEGYCGTGEKPCCPGGAATDLWRYSPSTNTWTSRNNIPIDNLSALGTSVGGKGYTAEGFGPIQMSEYNPVSDSWTKVGPTLNANFTGYPHRVNSVFLMDDRIFLFFRHPYNYTSADNFIYEFNSGTGTWTRRAAYFDEKSVGFSINGTGYIAGLNSIHQYDLSTNQVTLDKIQLPYSGALLLFTINSKAYFLGTYVNNHYEFWEFDPAYL